MIWEFRERSSWPCLTLFHPRQLAALQIGAIKIKRSTFAALDLTTNGWWMQTQLLIPRMLLQDGIRRPRKVLQAPVSTLWTSLTSLGRQFAQWIRRSEISSEIEYGGEKLRCRRRSTRTQSERAESTRGTANTIGLNTFSLPPCPRENAGSWRCTIPSLHHGGARNASILISKSLTNWKDAVPDQNNHEKLQYGLSALSGPPHHRV